MTTDQIANKHQARPFRPFAVHLADGTSYDVPHPEFLWRTPGGRTIFISGGEENVAIVDLLLVTKFTFGNGANGRRRRR